MKVKGNQCIEVDVSVSELLRGIADYFHVTHCVFPGYDSYAKIEVDKKTHKKLLNLYTNWSHHGSPTYEITQTITDENCIKAYEHIKALVELDLERREDASID